MRRTIPLVLLLVTLLAAPAQALYIRPDLEKVPIDRLVENLEALVKKNEKDAKARLNLARVHAMAYALKTDMADAWKGKPQDGAWFGYEPAHVPFKAKPTDDADKQKAAKAHLEKAIERYKETIKLAPENLTARLGLAWSIDQSGDKKAAIKEYRDVIEEAWKKEKDLKSGGLGFHSVTAEAGGYLIPLLDAEKDKEEIATLNDRSKKMRMLPRPITPLAIPLRDGLELRDLVDANARVPFDADGTGLKKPWTWITRDAGWLVHDLNGKGEVTSALQMFGGVSFWLFWDNGYHALSALDDNRDGVLSGTELRGLAIWHDVNGNGISEPGEVKPLAEHGIVALSCRYEFDANHPDRIAFSRGGVTFGDGSRRATFDIVLHPAK